MRTNTGYGAGDRSVARRASGRPSLRSWGRFNVVGAFGIAVQLATLALLVRGAKANYLGATLVAVEASVLHNFVWHTRWTWADRIDEGSSRARMFFRFHLTSGGVSMLANCLFVPLLVGALGVDVLVANCATIAVCGVLNFVLSDRFAFL